MKKQVKRELKKLSMIGLMVPAEDLNFVSSSWCYYGLLFGDSTCQNAENLKSFVTGGKFKNQSPFESWAASQEMKGKKHRAIEALERYGLIEDETRNKKRRK